MAGDTGWPGASQPSQAEHMGVGELWALQREEPIWGLTESLQHQATAQHPGPVNQLKSQLQGKSIALPC